MKLSEEKPVRLERQVNNMSELSLKNKRYQLRLNRTRQKLVNPAKSPVLKVHRSLRHIYAQIIDCRSGKVICQASDLKVDKSGTKKDEAANVGSAIAVKALKAKIDKVVFDRAAYKYHGRVSALADAARAKGLQF